MKHIPSLGHPLAFGAAKLTASGLTGLLVPNGISGNSQALYLDIYGVTVSTSNIAPCTVTLSDGVTAVTYYAGGPPIADEGETIPIRFRKGAPLIASAASGLTGSVSVLVRGVYQST